MCATSTVNLKDVKVQPFVHRGNSNNLLDFAIAETNFQEAKTP